MKRFKVGYIMRQLILILFSVSWQSFDSCIHTLIPEQKSNKMLQSASIEEDKRDLINREIGKFRKTAEADEQKKEKEKDRRKREEKERDRDRIRGSPSPRKDKDKKTSSSRRRSRSRERSKVCRVKYMP